VNELEKALAAKDTKSSMKISQDATSKNQDFFMEQNIPNPFAGQTTIRYQLPNGTNKAEIMVFDLNGLLVKSFPINRNQNEITIKASDIGSGIFIYSLVQNGQELLTKKMIVK
jgi:Secretion system C-terminal sorting domain